ncbi:FAD-dependent monooxygenase [Streptomyces cocklensis]|uniref:12-dehydrotetracycline 5-monooxygenase/anhydrotetracycline 6-monooxygenase n=1 Tax=Actinacidiphila cocklensis TaxID=887465 RepID=A0A9W4DIJ3_9ACTN|nr:FAD-dependent monooxygenase [Actinacidiphila cocklensis]MDD1058702.1 FAD-dependent monooxygenase [Actinacidiphila cocklensis]WSX75094.1 FAD-dependent monooxygenase [Streptomyces sp. NBC_00899]CAG6390892.1 12-dehydrotetracycline 5-monooxygenase/anhydrotetracycline 6-monooxygenase [Actinacidiphila cocklensis]
MSAATDPAGSRAADDTQVVVVGAGPVGLMLAGELRLGGAQVVVLERREAPTTESRASTLHARTMEMFDARGLLTDLGTPPNEPRGHFGGVPMDLTLPSLHPGQWKVPQTRTEELLQKWALSLGADLRRGWEVRALTDTGDGVEVVAAGPEGERRLRAAWVVACDGQDSTVRGLLGADFPGRAAVRELLRADVEGIAVADRRFERLPNGLAIASRMPGGVTRVMVHAFGRPAGRRTGEPGFAEVVETWRHVTGEDIGHGRPVWVNAFDDANRQLASYRHGRVLFAGDAAHVQMPSGGQALNLGLQDAANLGWKLALEVGPHRVEGLVDTYHAERHAVGSRVLANIRAQGLLLLGGPEVEPVRALLAELLAAEGAREHLAGMISGLDIRYPADPEPGHPLTGARLPDLELDTATGPATTAELLRPGGGLLLDLVGRPGMQRLAQAWSGRVTTVAVRPSRAATATLAAEAVVVRPDGYVAWAGAGQDAVPGVLRRWFGTPLPDR